MGMNTKAYSKEGGSGGKRGHSNMVHWDFTESIKRVAKKARRRQNRHAIAEHLK